MEGEKTFNTIDGESANIAKTPVVRGYKALSSTLKSLFRSFQYAIGETYMIDGMPELQSRGFHFCHSSSDMFDYVYHCNIGNANARFCIVDASGIVLDGGRESVCSKIHIIREFMPIDLVAEVTKPSDIPAALEWATKLGFTDVVRALLEKPFFTEVADIMLHCNSATWAAMYNHHSTILELLINMPFPLGPSNMKVYKGRSLEYACMKGDIAETKRLLSEFIWEDKHCMLVNLLQSACETGQSEIVKLFADPSYSLDHWDASANSNRALRLAFKNNHLDIVHLLTLPPFFLGQADARANDNAILKDACTTGHSEIVSVLAEHPFLLGHEDIMADDMYALHIAYMNDHITILKQLAEPPFSVAYTDSKTLAMDLLLFACKHHHPDLIKCLQHPKFGLSHADVISNNYYIPYMVCKNGSKDILTLLSEPPFSLGHDDMIACNALAVACTSGWACDVVEALAKPPYSLTQTDARAYNSEALRNACNHFNGVKMLKILSRPPFLLGHDDAIACNNDAIRRAHAHGNEDLVKLLQQPPFNVSVDIILPHKRAKH